jgi:predicted dinucleotide-binding enzyme
MQVAIIGSGNVGRALAGSLTRAGHAVTLTATNPDNAKAAAEQAGASFAESNRDAVQRAEVVVLAVPYPALDVVLGEDGDALAGKVLVDTTNPLDFSSGRPGLFVGHTDSLGEQVQRAAPEARVVKALNIVNFNYMVDPDLPGGPPDMFIAGNDGAAKATVTEVLESFGWPVFDIGGIEGARELESLCLLWVLIGVRRGGFDHAFKLLTG